MVDQPSKHHLHSAVQALTSIAIGIASLTPIGYIFHQDRLIALFPGWQSMSLVTSLGIIFLAAPSWKPFQTRSSKPAIILALITLLMSFAVLLSHGMYRADIINPWFSEELLRSPVALTGRTSAATALCLAALSCSLLAARFSARRQVVAIIEIASNTALLVGGIALLGYAYRISDLYGVYLFETMSLQSALAIVCLAAGHLIAEPNTRLGMTLRSTSIGVSQLRRMLAFTALPAVLGWLLLHMSDSNVTGIGAAMAMLVIATSVSMFYLLLKNARTAELLEREQAAQRDIEQRLSLDLQRRLDGQSAELAEVHRREVESFALTERAKRSEVIAQLTGTIAHDFNNLLMVIGGSAQLLKLRMRSELSTAPLVDKIAATVVSAAKLTSQLSAFSRTQRLQTEAVHLDSVVRFSVAEMRSQLPPGIRLVMDLNAEAGTVLSDRGQLQMALVHLIRNASEAMAENGTLKITTSLLADAIGDQQVSVQVVDNGCGMTEETIRNAIEPFFTTKKGSHPGLGLAQVNSVVHQASGTVRISSTPSTGTIVELSFPCTSVRVEAPPVTNKQFTASASNKRLLVIDDDNEVRSVIVELLRHMQYDVSEASDGENGLRLLEQVEPALAIIDYLMPGMNGAEVARKVRLRIPGIPIIFISGYADSCAIKSIPHSRLLRKPVVLEELEKMVTGALYVN